MTRRTFITLIVVTLLIVPGLSVAAVTGSPDLSIDFTSDDLIPGENDSVDLVILNEGELTSSSVSNPALNSEVTTARGMTVKLKDNDVPFTVTTNKQAIGNLGEGSSGDITFDVAVEDGADTGSYSVPVVVSYSYYDYISEGDGARTEKEVTDELSTNVRIQDAAAIDIVNIKSEANVDGTGILNVTVENSGSVTANETEVTINSNNDQLTFGDGDSETRYLGSWEPGERRTLQYELSATDSAEPGDYPLTMDGSYQKPNGVEMETTTISFGTPVKPAQTFGIDNLESSLEVGTDGHLSGELTNTGNDSVDDLVLVWDSDQQNINPTETDYAIGTLDAGESASFDFDVEVSEAARSGPRQFSLVAEYENEQGSTLESDPIAVQESVAAERDEFDLEIQNATVRAGASGALELKITNNLDEPVSDVSAKVFTDSPIAAGDDEAFIAELSPGQTKELVFGVSAAGGAIEKNYPVSMDFQYDQADGDTVSSDTYRVPISVTTGGDGGGGVPPLAIGAVVVVLLVAGIGGYLRFR
jgi:hypothetical protein